MTIHNLPRRPVPHEHLLRQRETWNRLSAIKCALERNPSNPDLLLAHAAAGDELVAAMKGGANA